MTTQWETVRVFISSTFDDMHAERDYLVKQVFPELREWCEKRKIRLVDIDLRWGVKEEDTQNKNVVEVCLRRIDEARPFFLCFMGQRRGWVPQEEEVSSSTLAENAFPDLKNRLGKTSVTEMEILHALANPFHRSRITKDQPPEYYDPVKYSFFYLRDPSYLEQLPKDFPPLRKVYTNEGIQDDQERAAADQELEKWVKQEIPALCKEHARPYRFYTARWNPDATSPELLLPLACPSLVPDNVKAWQRKWADAGLKISGTSIDKFDFANRILSVFKGKPKNGEISENSDLAKAKEYNRLRTGGRLTGFEGDGKPLSEVIIEDLQTAISDRFPEHMEIAEVGDLQKELDQQEQYLSTAGEGFIERGGDFDELDAYVKGDSNQLFVLTAEGGMGKSSLLAKWVDRYRKNNEYKADESIHFRFIGQSDLSTTVFLLLKTLFTELKEVNGKIPDKIADKPFIQPGTRSSVSKPHMSPAMNFRGIMGVGSTVPKDPYLLGEDKTSASLVVDEILNDPQKLQQELLKLLWVAGKKGKTIIVLDALNQLESGLSDMAWLPIWLPEKVKLIVSFKRGEDAAEELLQHMQGRVILAEVKPFANLEDRRELVRVYLDQYLKQLDPPLLDALIQLPGAANPLYLKVVLSELRVFGAFPNLGERIRSDFGETPVSAFEAVLRRLESDPAYSPVDPNKAVPLIFGMLAHARNGLTAGELGGILRQGLVLGENPAQRQASASTLQLYLRQVRSFLVHREGRYDFFFESFKLAVQQRYVSVSEVRKQMSLHGALDTSAKNISSEVDMLPPKWTAQEWHHLLARYFTTQPLYAKGEIGQIPDLRKLSELPYQEAYAGLAEELTNTLSDFDFMEAKTSAIGVQQLIDDYDLIDLSAIKTENGSANSLKLIQAALRLSVQTLARDPNQLASQLFGRLHSFQDGVIQHLLEQGKGWNQKTCLKLLMGSLTSPGGALLNTLPENSSIKAVAISSDGKQAVSASEYSEIKVWDLEEYRELTTLRGHTRSVNAVVLTADGKRVISASDDWTIKVWAIDSSAMLATMEGHKNRIRSVVLTPDERRAISASDDKTLKVWDLERYFGQYTFVGHTGYVTAVALTPDGRRVISASSDKTVMVWDLESRKVLHTLGERTADAVPDPRTNGVVAVTPDSRMVIAGSNHPTFYDPCIYVWNLEEGRLVTKMEGHTTGGITALAVTPDGKRVVSGSADKTIKVWDLKSGQLLHSFDGHSDKVSTVALTPDGRRAISASWDKTLKVWDLDLYEEITTLTGNKVENIAIAVSQDGRRAVSAGGESLQVWDLGRMEKTASQVSEPNIWVKLKPTPDWRRAISSEGNTLKVWDLENCVELATLAGHNHKISQLELTLDGKRAVSEDESFCKKVWDLERFSELASITHDRMNDLPEQEKQVFLEKEITRISLSLGRLVSPDGKRAIEIYNSSLMNQFYPVVRDLEQYHSSGRLMGHTREVKSVVFLPDGKRAITTSNDNTFRVWDLESCVELASMTDQSKHTSVVVVIPDGRRAITVSANSLFEKSSLKVWDLEKYTELVTLTGHASRVTSVVVTPDGKRAISASNDITKVWDLESYAELVAFPGQTGPVGPLLFLPDGTRVVSTGNGIFAVWDMENYKALKPLAYHHMGSFTITPDGKRAVSRSGNTLKVWDLEKLNCLASFTNEVPIGYYEINASGSMILAGGLNGMLYLLKLVMPDQDE